jgi:hypothetical protein
MPSGPSICLSSLGGAEDGPDVGFPQSTFRNFEENSNVVG